MGLVLGLMLPARGAETPTPLTPHRAVYDLTLQSVSGGQIVSASGSMTYVLSDACSAWSTQQELNLQTASRSGVQTEIRTDYAVLEDKDGGHMVFRTHQYGSGVTEQKISGEATMTATGGQVRYTQPGVSVSSPLRRVRCFPWRIPARSSPPDARGRPPSNLSCSMAPRKKGPSTPSLS